MTDQTKIAPAASRLLVPPKEAWRLLSIGNTKGYELIKSGVLEVVKFGKATRITMASIRRAAGEAA